jgi:predicted MPP superfamily phosphohydrolase
LRGILIAVSIALGLFFSVHYYIWLRLVHDTALPEPFASASLPLLALLFLSQPASLITMRAVPKVGRIMAWPAFIWMGSLLLLLVTLGAADLAKLFLHLDLERVRYLEGAAALAAASLVAVSVMRARSLHVREVEVRLDKLPRALDGFTIAQLSDIHVGPTIRRPFMAAMVARVNELAADAVCITGDLADGSVRELYDAIEPLRDLRAKHGSFFVTGNHEYYNDVDEWLEAVSARGIRVLRNEHLPLGDGLILAGIDDLQGRIRAGHGPDLKKALKGVPHTAAVVLLAHQPKMWPQLAAAGIDLVLSGHTHAGQIWPFNYLVKIDQPVVQGLVRDGASQLFVSAGTGYWGPPMRLGSTAEITKIVLRSSSS